MISDRQQRSLLVTRNLPPLVGGMERLVWQIAVAIRQNDESVHVVGPTGCGDHLPFDISCDETPIRPMWRFLVGAAIHSIAFALTRRPRLVLAGSGLTAPIAWVAAWLAGSSSAVYLHGLDIEVEHRFYRLFWRPFFRHFDRVLVNSHYTRGLAIKAGISAERIQILHPGVTLPDLSQADGRRSHFREHFSLGECPLMLYVGRINPRKGLAVFVRHMLPSIVTAIPGAQLIVIGDEPKHALQHTPGEWAKVRQSLQESGLAHAVHFLGPQSDKTLSDAYMAADVMIFPVQEIPGDIEGFGMVAIEAAAHDLPTVAFAVGGVPDAVKDGVSGRLISAGDHNAFSRAVIRHLTDRPLKNFAARQFAESFCWQAFGERLHTVLKSGTPSPP